MTIEKDVDLSLWEPLPVIPNTSNDYRGYAMASVRDTVYISGGLGSDTVHKSLRSYDMITRKWTTLPDMISCRWGHRLAILEGGRYLFAIGGWGHKSNNNTAEASKKKSNASRTKLQLQKLTSFEVYDVSKQQWKEAGDLREARRDFAISVDLTSGKIYVIGGTGTNGALSTVEVYDPHAHEFRSLASMPRPCRYCHAIHVGSQIYVLEAGRKTLTYDTILDMWSSKGTREDSHIPRCPNRGNILCSSSSSSSLSQGEVIVYGYVVEEVNGHLTNRWMIAHIARKRSKSWTVLPPADEFMYYRTVLANGKLVVAIGNSLLAFQVVDEDIGDDDDTIHSAGFSTGSTFNESTSSGTSETEVIEPIKGEGTWVPQPRPATIILNSEDNSTLGWPPDYRGYAVASAGNKVYISGGFSGDQTVHCSLVCYNVKKKKWKVLPRMTHHRLGHRMVVSGDGCYIYVLGGGDGKSLRSLGIEIYDIKKKKWTSGPAMNTYRVFFGVTVCHGKVFVFGGVGSKNGNELGLVEFYDPTTNCWQYAKPMPEARGVCNVISMGHTIYVFGTPSQKVLAYDFIAGEWLNEIASDALPLIPSGGCVCASSTFASGEVLVMKYPLSDQSRQKQRRTAHVYNAPKQCWTFVDLDDDLQCYSSVVAGDKIVVVTPQNQLMACSIPKKCS